MAKQKVLITGGNGMLATDLTKLFTEKGYDVFALGKDKLDITNYQQVSEFFKSNRPDLVINTPCCHVDPSEDSPKTAYAINAWGAKLIADQCHRANTTMIQISSCGLFGDDIRAYNEYDPVTLKTCYARSKYEGENFVRNACEKYFVIRMGWLYGGEAHHARNFIVARYREALQTNEMRSAGDKYGSPTFTMDVGETILKLLETEQYGLYHVANEGGGSRAEYVQAIVRAFGLDIPVKEVDSSYFPRKANVPDCEILTSYNLSYAGVPLLEPWEEALARYVQIIKKEM